MVPIALLFLVATELAVYSVIGRHFLGAPWDAVMVGTLAAFLGLRAGIIAVTWVFAYTYPSPARPLAVCKKLSMMIGEYLAFLLTFAVVLPLERLWMPPDRLRPCATPLLLVHGYGCSRGVWWWLRRRFEAAGHTVASVSMTPPYTNIGKLVPQLNRRIEEVCRATGADQVILVAHSMGGLVCRSYLARHGGRRVEKLVTLASPHAGTELARIGFGKNAREMEPGSRWLKDLSMETIPVPVVSIRTPHDNYVMPQDSQRLPGATDIELDGIGHLAVLYGRRAANAVLAACR